MIEDNKTATPISELGEFGLIKILTDPFKPKNPATIKGVGDDCAVIKASDKSYKLVTTDLLVEGIHFNLMYTPLKHLGYKAVTVNLSDIYAMNGTPEQILVSIAISGKFTIEALEELYSGIYHACEKYKVDLIGGDTSTSLTGLMISVTAIGSAAPEKIVYRSGAKPTDIICVSGNLGAAYAGLQVLEREKELFVKEKIQPDLDKYDYILERQLKPEARKDIIELLKKENIQPTSMIDVSDGLSSELMHICSQSETGCRIILENLPIEHQTSWTMDEFSIAAETAVLNGGEDYELLFTVPVSDFEKVKELKDITVIGYITERAEGINSITSDNRLIPLSAQGWNAFKK
ncbi:MAG: thiamine-phosphate kinase [Bacteroidetes bacterium HGW-Bacteroidetes-21]|jgi:thiamine-monophosphate kinase|nr:MAG: thiamine-phosphate kinase [Bacteroidetes bacterium HGW-Bacteroidetes-21]